MYVQKTVWIVYFQDMQYILGVYFLARMFLLCDGYSYSFRHSRSRTKQIDTPYIAYRKLHIHRYRLSRGILWTAS